MREEEKQAFIVAGVKYDRGGMSEPLGIDLFTADSYKELVQKMLKRGYNISFDEDELYEMSEEEILARLIETDGDGCDSYTISKLDRNTFELEEVV